MKSWKSDWVLPDLSHFRPCFQELPTAIRVPNQLARDTETVLLKTVLLAKCDSTVFKSTVFHTLGEATRRDGEAGPAAAADRGGEGEEK